MFIRRGFENKFSNSVEYEKTFMLRLWWFGIISLVVSVYDVMYDVGSLHNYVSWSAEKLLKGLIILTSLTAWCPDKALAPTKRNSARS